jgi:hypothetical protein
MKTPARAIVPGAGFGDGFQPAGPAGKRWGPTGHSQDWLMPHSFRDSLVLHKRWGRLESRPAAKIGQCHIVFPIPTISVNGGADALVRSRPPGRLLDHGKHLIHRGQERDEGVPPRTRGSAPPLVLSPTSRKLCGIGQDWLPHRSRTSHASKPARSHWYPKCLERFI